MAVYKYSEARQHLAELLQQAIDEGEVKILRKDGVVFILKPIKNSSSPFDLEALDIDIDEKEIVDAVKASRRSKIAKK